MICVNHRNNSARYWLLIESALMTFLLVVMETDKTLAHASLDDVTSRDAWKALCARQGIGLDLDLTLNAMSRSPQTAKSQRRALTRISRNLREGRHEAKTIKHMLVSDRLLDPKLALSLEQASVKHSDADNQQQQSSSPHSHRHKHLTSQSSSVAVPAAERHEHIVDRLREATRQVAMATIDVKQLSYSETRFDHSHFGPKYARLQQRLCVTYWELLTYTSAHKAAAAATATSPQPQSQHRHRHGHGTEVKDAVSRKQGRVRQRGRTITTSAPASLSRFSSLAPTSVTVDPAVRYARNYVTITNVHRLLQRASVNLRAVQLREMQLKRRLARIARSRLRV